MFRHFNYEVNLKHDNFQCCLKLILLSLLIFLFFLPEAAAAQSKPSGTKGGSKYQYQGEYTIDLRGSWVTDPRTQTSLPIAEVDFQWAMWVLLGQPVKTFVANYKLEKNGLITTSGVASCLDGNVKIDEGQFYYRTTGTEKKPPVEIFSTSVFRAWFISKDSKHSSRFFMDFKPDSMVPATHGYGISAPGSPEWARLFQRLTDNGSAYLTESEAKEIMRNGLELERIELIEPHLSVSTALSKHNQQVRIDCEEERQAKLNINPEYKSSNLTNKLNEMLNGDSATSESSAVNDGFQSSDKLSSLMDQFKDIMGRLGSTQWGDKLSNIEDKFKDLMGSLGSTPWGDKFSNLSDQLNVRLDDAFNKSNSSTINETGRGQSLAKQAKDATWKAFYDKSISAYGYKDHSGKVVIEPQFDLAYDFNFGYAHIQTEHPVYYWDHYLINTKGKPVLGPYYGMDDLGEFGLLAVSTDRYKSFWSYVDLSGNKVMDGFNKAHKFANGFARVVFSGDEKLKSTLGVGTTMPWYFIDQKGNRKFGPYHHAGDFVHGLALVQLGYEDKRYLKTDGSYIGPYADAMDFHESGFAVVRGMDGWGVINTKGDVVIPLNYSQPTIKYSDSGEVEFWIVVDRTKTGSCLSAVFEEYSQRFNVKGELIPEKILTDRREGELCLRQVR